MKEYELKELIHWLQEIKNQAAGPSCRQAIQTGIRFYEKQLQAMPKAVKK